MPSWVASWLLLLLSRVDLGTSACTPCMSPLLALSRMSFRSFFRFSTCWSHWSVVACSLGGGLSLRRSFRALSRIGSVLSATSARPERLDGLARPFVCCVYLAQIASAFAAYSA